MLVCFILLWTHPHDYHFDQLKKNKMFTLVVMVTCVCVLGTLDWSKRKVDNSKVLLNKIGLESGKEIECGGYNIYVCKCESYDIYKCGGYDIYVCECEGYDIYVCECEAMTSKSVEVMTSMCAIVEALTSMCANVEAMTSICASVEDMTPMCASVEAMTSMVRLGCH
ncbi:hypothetical protein Btru_036015 [Bulinus truncatus]|nr:hypothetical protein Btru_036015 [Bulinus truncatus]